MSKKEVYKHGVVLPFLKELQSKFPGHKYRFRRGDMGHLIDIDSKIPWYMLLFYRRIGKIRIIIPFYWKDHYQAIIYPLIQVKAYLSDAEEIIDWVKKRLEKGFQKVEVQWEYIEGGN